MTDMLRALSGEKIQPGLGHPLTEICRHFSIENQDKVLKVINDQKKEAEAEAKATVEVEAKATVEVEAKATAKVEATAEGLSPELARLVMLIVEQKLKETQSLIGGASVDNDEASSESPVIEVGSDGSFDTSGANTEEGHTSAGEDYLDLAGL
jgi:hypothetical protein